MSGVLQVFTPRPQSRAARWVTLLWEWDGYRSPASVERILPHGNVEVSWNLAAPHRFRSSQRWVSVPNAALVGARDEPYFVDTVSRAHLFGIVFEPGAATRLLGVSMAELSGGIHRLSDFPRGAELERRVGDARSAAARRDAALGYLATLPIAPRNREAQELLRAWGSSRGRGRSVGALRQALGLSAPTLVARVEEQLGMRPAQARQVLMFREAVAALAKGDSAARVAATTGYCDQAHLARAFRRHAGLTTRRFNPWLAGHPFNLPEPDTTP